jgi:hypothetical protein
MRLYFKTGDEKMDMFFNGPQKGKKKCEPNFGLLRINWRLFINVLLPAGFITASQHGAV